MSRPHQAVVFRFRNNATRQLVKQMIRPKCFGSERPIGCIPPAPTIVVDDTVLKDLSSKDPEVLKQGVSKGLEHMIGVAEKELCMQFDMVDDEGKPLDRYLGRGKEARVVKRPAIPRGCLQQGRVDARGLGLRWFRLRLLDLIGILRLAQRAKIKHPQELQWWRIMRQLWRPAGFLKKLIDSDPCWHARAHAVALLAPQSTHTITVLKAWAKEADEEAAAVASRTASAAKQSWKAWVQRQL